MRPWWIELLRKNPKHDWLESSFIEQKEANDMTFLGAFNRKNQCMHS